MKSRIEKLATFNLELANRLSDFVISNKRMGEEIEQLKKEKEQLRDKIQEHERTSSQGDSEVRRLRDALIYSNTYHEVIPLCDKLIDLQSHLAKIEDDCRQKKEEMELTARQTRELKKVYSELLKIESQLGFENLRELPEMYRKSIEEFDQFQRDNSDLKFAIKCLEQDRANKEVLLEKKDNEIKILMYLNHELINEWRLSDPSANPLKYSKEFFARRKFHVTNETVITIDDLYRDIGSLQSQVASLQKVASLERRQIDSLKASIEEKTRTIEALNKRLDSHQSDHLTLHRERSVHDQSNSSIKDDTLVQEQSLLKDQVAHLTTVNHRLNMQLVDLEIDNKKKEAVVHQLQGDIAQITTMYKESVSLPAADFSRQDNELLAEENSLLHEKIQAYKQLYSVLSTYKCDLDTQFSDILPTITSLIYVDSQIKQDIEVNRELVRANLTNRVLQERDLLHRHKIHALQAYIDVVNNKCSNMNNIIVECMDNIERLQKERDSLEANTYLEKVKQYLEQKSNELTEYNMKMDQIIVSYDNIKTSMLGDNSSVSSRHEQIQEELMQQIDGIKTEYNARFEAIIAACEQKAEDAKSHFRQQLEEKEAELSRLQAKVASCEYEGKASILVQLSGITSIVLELKRELTDAHSHLKMMDLTIDAVDKINRGQTSEMMASIASKVTAIIEEAKQKPVASPDAYSTALTSIQAHIIKAIPL